MIILQKIIENKRTSLNIPSEWLYRDLDKFGLEWELFSYQKEALGNIISVLYLIYKDADRFRDNDLEKNKTELFRLYQECGLSSELVEELAITKQNENFDFLSKYFTTDIEIPFQNFINRAAFWMATGCGKTLVMIKLLAILSDLMYKKLIPKKDILILAPKDEILSQIKDHINKFNKGAEIKINLRNLKEWERIKNQQDMFSKSEMNVFYYRADNIGDKGTISKKKDGQRIDYESIYNNGNWYLILDEAHKGEKETSKRQQYFMALTQNGFLFNFSATFTEEIDKVTTVFDYKLDTFLKEGYGKKLYISDSDFKSFIGRQSDDFSEEEKKGIIAQTLIIFALAKKHFSKLNKINKNLYHSPLLITLANSVNTEEADLKLFYTLLSEIARGRFDFERTKRNLVEKLENQKGYLFGLGEIDDRLIGEIRTLEKEDFFKNVFHTEKKGNIEVTKFRDNDRELAFKHVGADKYFMLIVASDIIKWEENVLDGYQWGRAIEESFFEDINKRNSINILLGSRIFSEGWDTNRPNIINFINIGISDDAQKFVLQSIGRGIRIEPLPNKRKRFDNLEDKSKFSIKEIEKIEKENKILESLFIFATNKEVVKNILEGLEKQAQAIEWIKVEGIKKNERIKEKDLPIFIPVFKDGGLNNKPFWIGNKEYGDLSKYVQKSGPKVLLLKSGIKLRTFKKLSDKNSFKLGERRRHRTAENILFVADSYFNESVQILDKLKILDGEISHYREVKTRLEKEEVGKLEKDILKVIKPKKSGAEIFQMVKEGKITQKEFEELDKNRIRDENIDVLRKHLDFTVLEEHYYKPILYRQNTDHFQHILKNKSEIDFLIKLKKYLAREDNLLKKYDWWYFSKIDESIDKIGIPYFDEEKSKYRTFCPDFIFWLKKNNKYYLKFIDPKGIEYTTNPASKINGFEEFLEEYGRLKNKELEKIDLFYFNAEQPHFDRNDEYRKYWIDDFNKIFSDIGSDSDIVSDLFFSDVISEDSVTEHQKYTEYFPVLTLEAAATVFGKEQHVEPLGWKKAKARKCDESLFIAHVVGKSMEPMIPDGSWCLFRFERGGSRNGLVVLVESRLVTDPETSQKFTIKRYKSEKEDLGNGQWTHKKIILSPDNKVFKDIVLENVSGDDFRVVAEFVEILKSNEN